MEMEKSFYVVTSKPAYLHLLRAKAAAEDEIAQTRRMVIAITQGGFGQDVVDDERQAKERFLEYLFLSSDIDLPRTSEVFDEFFELVPADEFVDLDDEL